MKFVSYLEILAGAAIVFFVENKVAHMLGYLLIFIGLSYIIWDEEIRLNVDEQMKVVRWQKKKLFKKTQKVIPFSDIKRVFVQRVGKASTFTEFYCISLELNSGEIINNGDRYSEATEAQTKADLLTATLK